MGYAVNENSRFKLVSVCSLLHHASFFILGIAYILENYVVIGNKNLFKDRLGQIAEDSTIDSLSPKIRATTGIKKDQTALSYEMPHTDWTSIWQHRRNV